MSARCLACGGEAVARERRVLNSEAARNVLAAWKEILQLKAIELCVSLSKEFLAVGGWDSLTGQDVCPESASQCLNDTCGLEKLCVEWGSTNTAGTSMFKISHIHKCEVKT